MRFWKKKRLRPKSWAKALPKGKAHRRNTAAIAGRDGRLLERVTRARGRDPIAVPVKGKGVTAPDGMDQDARKAARNPQLGQWINPNIEAVPEAISKKIAVVMLRSQNRDRSRGPNRVIRVPNRSVSNLVLKRRISNYAGS